MQTDPEWRQNILLNYQFNRIIDANVLRISLIHGLISLVLDMLSIIGRDIQYINSHSMGCPSHGLCKRDNNGKE